MDETKLTESNLRKALIAAYDREVALHPECEEGYQSLAKKQIDVSILKHRVKVQFPCLQVQSVAALCAHQAIELVWQQFFCGTKHSGTDIIGVISEKERGSANLKTTPGHLFWVHEFDSAKKE